MLLQLSYFSNDEKKMPEEMRDFWKLVDFGFDSISLFSKLMLH